MTEEIKETLEILKDFANNEISDYVYDSEGYEYEIINNAINKVLDCMTNLQQLYENALKVNQNENKYRTELEDKYVVLQQENEKLKENLCKNIVYERWYIHYKSRCEKAIEYLENLWSFPSGNFEVAINKEENKSIDIDGNEYIDNLLNILNGSDEK